MPRRPTETEQCVPLFLVPHVLMKGIRNHGDEVEWAIVKKTRRHYYTVSIRSRPLKREFRGTPAVPTGAENSGGAA